MIPQEQQKVIHDRLMAKQKAYEEQGYADKDFSKKVDDKHIKIWLPDSVFVQQKLLSLGSKVFGDYNLNIDEESDLTERFSKAVCSHMQIDQKTVVPETLEFGELQAYALLYWLELLSPLSAWGDAKAQRVILG